MVIGTFTSGETTQIGIKSKNGKSFHSVESKIIYQDPEKFVGRFLSLLHVLFNINSLDNCTLIFVISGIINQENKVIIQSDVLNNISVSKYFNGFNFVKIFRRIN